MTAGHLDFLGHADWRKRIHQLKQELRSAAPEPSRTSPEQAKSYGTELKPKRHRPSAQPPRANSQSASRPPRPSRSYASG